MAFEHLNVFTPRRITFNYVAPAVCEAVFSGSGEVSVSLQPIVHDQVAGIVWEWFGEWGRLSWGAYPGALCYSVYKLVDEEDPFSEYVLIAECVTDNYLSLLAPGTYKVEAITPDGAVGLSDPVVGEGDPVTPICEDTGGDTPQALVSAPTSTFGMDDSDNPFLQLYVSPVEEDTFTLGDSYDTGFFGGDPGTFSNYYTEWEIPSDLYPDGCYGIQYESGYSGVSAPYLYSYLGMLVTADFDRDAFYAAHVDASDPYDRYVVTDATQPYTQGLGEDDDHLQLQILGGNSWFTPSSFSINYTFQPWRRGIVAVEPWDAGKEASMINEWNFGGGWHHLWPGLAYSNGSGAYNDEWTSYFAAAGNMRLFWIWPAVATGINVTLEPHVVCRVMRYGTLATQPTSMTLVNLNQARAINVAFNDFSGDMPRAIYTGKRALWKGVASGSFGGARVEYSRSVTGGLNNRGWRLKFYAADQVTVLWQGVKKHDLTPAGTYLYESGTISGASLPCCLLAET